MREEKPKETAEAEADTFQEGYFAGYADGFEAGKKASYRKG